MYTCNKEVIEELYLWQDNEEDLPVCWHKSCICPFHAFDALFSKLGEGGHAMLVGDVGRNFWNRHRHRSFIDAVKKNSQPWRHNTQSGWANDLLWRLAQPSRREMLINGCRLLLLVVNVQKMMTSLFHFHRTPVNWAFSSFCFAIISPSAREIAHSTVTSANLH